MDRHALLQLIDDTRLGDKVENKTITALCQEASHANVAAICIPPQFIKMAKAQLKGPTSVATVVNFPHGQFYLEKVLTEIEKAMALGADEIDVVFPYHQLLKNDFNACYQFVKACKYQCQDKPLKVIIESGELKDPVLIEQTTYICCASGADFVKTSTGFTKVGATLEAATVILNTIQEYQHNTEKLVGFKVSGGVRDVKTALSYVDLARNILGETYLSAKTFRIGASQLVTSLL